MTLTLLFAIVCMILALTCYSIGVWGEKLSGKLKRWHLVFFWIGSRYIGDNPDERDFWCIHVQHSWRNGDCCDTVNDNSRNLGDDRSHPQEKRSQRQLP